jgi:hypothetical protein
MLSRGVEEVTLRDIAQRARWKCPRCLRAFVRLYFQPNGGLLCRTCARLAYASEMELKVTRATTVERVDALQARADAAPTFREAARRQRTADRAAALFEARELARALRSQLSSRRKLVRALAALTEDAPAPGFLDAECSDLETAVAAAEQRVKALESAGKRTPKAPQAPAAPVATAPPPGGAVRVSRVPADPSLRLTYRRYRPKPGSPGAAPPEASS